MPRKPKTPCTGDPRCPMLVSRPGPCREHARERAADRVKRETWRDYGPEWQRARVLALARKPFCDCGKPTVDVDHVIPLRAGGTHEQSNLDPLCRSCHSAKTARQNGFGGAHT